MHFHYMAMPKHKNPCPDGHEIYNLGRLFLGHHYNPLSLSDECLRVVKKTFNEIHQFYTAMVNDYILLLCYLIMFECRNIYIHVYMLYNL